MIFSGKHICIAILTQFSNLLNTLTYHISTTGWSYSTVTERMPGSCSPATVAGSAPL